MRNTTTHCPKCGGQIPCEALQGICPKCALAAVATSTEAGPAASKGVVGPCFQAHAAVEPAEAAACSSRWRCSAITGALPPLGFSAVAIVAKPVPKPLSELCHSALPVSGSRQKISP